MANTFYAKQSHSTNKAFLFNMIRYMINDAGYSGPNWSLVFAYSDAETGDKHQVPSDPHDANSFTGASFAWKDGLSAGLTAGDFFVLESASGSNKFQVGIEYQSATVIRIIVAPKEGFAIAGTNADMTNASYWANAKLTTDDFPSINGASWYSIISNTDRFILENDNGNGNTLNICYEGKYLDAHTTDEYCCISCLNNFYYFGQMDYSNSYFTKLSPVDDTSVLTIYGSELRTSGGYTGPSFIATDTASGEYRLLPIYIVSITGGHVGTFGRLDGMYMTSGNLIGTSNKCTLGSKTYAAIKGQNAAAGNSPIVFDWDGTTTI